MSASCTETSSKVIYFTAVEAATLMLLDGLSRTDEEWRWVQLRARLDALAAREPGSSSSSTEGGGR